MAGEDEMMGIAAAILVIIIIAIIIATESHRQQCACQYRGKCGPLCGCGRYWKKERRDMGCMHHSGAMSDEKARKFKRALTGSSAAAGPRSFRDFEVREYPTIVG